MRFQKFLLIPVLLGSVIVTKTQAVGTLDSDGWTNIPETANTRTVYVSDGPEGDDQNAVFCFNKNPLSGSNSPTAAQIYSCLQTRPISTLATARNLFYGTKFAVGRSAVDARNGFNATRILFKRGGVWTLTGDQILGDLGGSSSANEPKVVGAYGNGPRPILQTAADTDSGFNFGTYGRDYSHFAIVGLHLIGNGLGVGIRLIGTGSDFLIEDCQIEKFRQNVSFDPIKEGPFSNLVLRRNLITDAFDATRSAAVAVGFYASYVNGILVEENNFHHNGWKIPSDRITINHDIYIKDWATNATVRGNIFVDGLDSVQVRCGGKIENNLSVRTAIGLTTFISWGHIADNVVLEGNTMYPNSSTQQWVRPWAWGININGGTSIPKPASDPLVIERNLVSKNIAVNNICQFETITDPVTKAKKTICKSVIGVKKYIPKGLTITITPTAPVVISDNFFYDWKGALTANFSYTPLDVERNWFQSNQAPDGTGSQATAITDIHYFGTGKATHTFSGNHYFNAVKSPSIWLFTFAAYDLNLTSGMRGNVPTNMTGMAFLNEPNAQWGAKIGSDPFPETPILPTTVSDDYQAYLPKGVLGFYNESLGSTPTTEGFVADMLKQSRYRGGPNELGWRCEYTAAVANNYFRAAHQMAAQPVGRGCN